MHYSLRAIFALFLFFTTLSYSSAIYGQEVVATAGGSHSTENLQVSWTLGELSIHTISNDELILTQGFHQTKYSIIVVEDDNDDIELTIYPNPTRDNIYLLIKSELDFSDWKFVLYDLKGAIIQTSSIQSDRTQISMRNLAPAGYILKVMDKSKSIKTFKIIKN